MTKRTYKTEKDVKAQVKKLLDAHGFYWWMPPANGYGKSGAADIMALRDGLFLAIETKFGTRKPTAMQKAFLQSILAHDGMAFVVSDRTVDAFETWLKEFDAAAAQVAGGQKVDPARGAAMLDAIAVLTEQMVSGR